MDVSSSMQTTETSRVSGSLDFNLEDAVAQDDDKTVGKKFTAAKSNLTWNNVRRIVLRKSFAVYALIIVFVWLIHTLPIILFFATSATFSPDGLPPNITNTPVSGCSKGFFLDNITGVCLPECGEWDQYPTSTRRAVFGITITFAFLTILVCAVAVVWSIFRYKIMFRYPNIILIYISISHTVFSIIHLIGYIDTKALYCTSRDRVTSFEEGSPFCNVIGVSTTFLPSFNLTGLCFHLGTVLYTTYFPFRARKMDKKGGYKYLHLIAVICALGVSMLLVGFQYAVGGYSRNVVPIFCIGDPESAFYFGIIPICFISATFLTFVMILLFKVIDIDWLKHQKTEISNTSTSANYRMAQIKLILIFCTHGLATLIIYSTYSVVLRREKPFADALDEYFDCESFGYPTNLMCSRDKFENIDPTSITFPLCIISYVLLPISTLVYVVKFELVITKIKTKFSF